MTTENETIETILNLNKKKSELWCRDQIEQVQLDMAQFHPIGEGSWQRGVHSQYNAGNCSRMAN